MEGAIAGGVAVGGCWSLSLSGTVVVLICDRSLGGRPPSPQLAGSDAEEDKLGAGSSGGDFGS